MNQKPMMKCGHRANATSDGKDCCVICAGINKGHDEIAEEPDLSKRNCKCSSCGKIVPSINAMAFFKHKPDNEFDEHYDGCGGWD